MQYRTLGRTGVQVSTLALGAMNFGAIGRTTQDEATAIVDAALEAGINLIDTADMYGQGESEEMVGKAIAGRRDDIVLATKATMPMGDERNHQGSSRRWLVTAAGQQPAPARRRPRRPLPDPPVGPDHQRRGDAVGADRPAARGEDPLLRLLDVPRVPHRAGPVGRPRAPPEPLRHRAAQLLDPAARDRDPRPARDRAVRARRAGVESAGLGLAVGRGPRGPGDHHQPLGRSCRNASTPPSRPTGPGSTPSSSWPRSPTRPA